MRSTKVAVSLVILLLLSLMVAAAAPAQDPPAPIVKHRSFLVQIPGWYWHNQKASYTDLWHDKKWFWYSLVADTAQLLDTSTTSYGMAHGYRDEFAGHSQAKLWGGTLALHFLIMRPMTHAMGEEMQYVCENDNSAPEEWKHIKDPKGCRYAFWVGAPAAAIHIHNAVTNLQMFQRPANPAIRSAKR